MYIKGYNFSGTDAHLWHFRPKKGSRVTLSIPHDTILGKDDFGPMFQARIIKGPKNSKIRDCREWNLWNIALQIMLMSRVYVVRGLIERLYIDYNRPKEKAFIDPKLEQYYNRYHQAIDIDLFEESLADIRSGVRPKLLIDLHGYSSESEFANKYDIIFGTRHKKTVFSNIDKTLASHLRKMGWRVYLPEKEKVYGEKFTGGHTIYRHGKKKKINAIQIELSADFREKDKLSEANKLSCALANFINEYNSQ